MENLLEKARKITGIIKDHPALSIAEKNCKAFEKGVKRARRKMWTGLGVMGLFVVVDVASGFFYDALWLGIVLLIGTVIAFFYSIKYAEMAEFGKGMIAGTQDLAGDLIVKSLKDEIGDCICGMCDKKEKKVEVKSETPDAQAVPVNKKTTKTKKNAKGSSKTK